MSDTARQVSRAAITLAGGEAVAAGGGYDFDRAHRKRLHAEMAYLDHKGLSTRAGVHAKLDGLYIDLSLDPCPLQQVDENLLGQLPAEDMAPRRPVSTNRSA
ncbi:hypothetical protein [Kutzneria buriramensis]|uniref:Uncharacterized protein n=1 Tax=Kutzneria buriramensis TaxID=1045776 RepID=A0A3E0GZU3_9PSEU|nr:hypothetical protein [Kutzneria buriramensis]REH35671.1 hypothetical protein BCF44_11759 [Kutzneria buriramensis]